MSLILPVSIAVVLWHGPSALAAGSDNAMQGKPLSRAETETLVKKDLAARLKVAVPQVEVVEVSDRTWPDEGLGCVARKGLREPVPVPGFAFTLAYAGKTFVYHTDRSGRFVRCDLKKPIDPISR
jgi:hypothetical protein